MFNTNICYFTVSLLPTLPLAGLVASDEVKRAGCGKTDRAPNGGEAKASLWSYAALGRTVCLAASFIRELVIETVLLFLKPK